MTVGWCYGIAWNVVGWCYEIAWNVIGWNCDMVSMVVDCKNNLSDDVTNGVYKLILSCCIVSVIMIRLLI